jgi:hypothetical protein
MGLEGSGKTDSIRTLLEAGLKVFCVFLEPGMEVLQDGTRGRKVYTCAEGLHWRYIPVGTPTWADLLDAADKLNKLSFQALADSAPINRERFRAFYEMYNAMANLKCDRCGQSFGPADQLPYDEWAIVNDSLTSISKAALFSHIGTKAAAHKGEYGNCMFAIERYIDKFTNDLACMAIMMAHIDREPNEVTGGVENMVATLGQKLAPKIPRPFSDAVLARREGGTFWWSTVDTNYRLKTRNFPFENKIPPTFVPVVQKWRERIKAEEAAQAKPQEQPKP